MDTFWMHDPLNIIIIPFPCLLHYSIPSFSHKKFLSFFSIFMYTWHQKKVRKLISCFISTHGNATMHLNFFEIAINHNLGRFAFFIVKGGKLSRMTCYKVFNHTYNIFVKIMRLKRMWFKDKCDFSLHPCESIQVHCTF